VVVDLANVQQKTLVDFVSKRSRDVFATLTVPDGFSMKTLTTGMISMRARL
jgi:hypothetical protein